LWMGRSAAVKGPTRFLELARLKPGLKFTMVCQPAADDMDFGKLASEAAGIHNLTFVPGVPFGQTDTYFAGAKVLVNTSDSEGFPNVFVQATKYGVPILSLNVNPDGFLDKYRCGLCAGGDWRRFVEMLDMLLDAANYAAYSENARGYFNENHDMGTIIAKYKESLIGSADGYRR
ncbi:MAG TPA: glycosyltransferase, partial [Sedimentisphaerales bacterium]|nr:glycosyltransferase [Sedimentisphaerales bacterium]